MPVNRNALIRYKTIDTCLRNKYKQWTLEDLIDACSDALYEYEGIDKGISKRTVQMDIQMMRSESWVIMHLLSFMTISTINTRMRITA